MLIVLLLERPTDAVQLHWWLTSREGVLLETGQDELAVLHTRFPGERLRPLAPASAISLYRVAIPVRRTAAARAALPFALEDQLGQELEELHLITGPRRSDGRFAAAVAEHRWVAGWLELWRSLGWRPDALIPLASLHHDQSPEQGLRIQPSIWPEQNDVALVTSVDEEPVLVEHSMLGFWLTQRLEQLPQPQRIVELLGYRAAELGLADTDCRIEHITQGASLEAALKTCQQPVRTFNLLTGDYASGMATPPWRKLRPTMVAAGVLLVLLVAQQALHSTVLNNERDRLETEINQLFDDTLPQSRRVEPVTQFRQVLQGNPAIQTSQNRMGSLLHDVLASVGTDSKANIRQFRASPDSVELELQLASFAELEQLRNKLATNTDMHETLQGADSDNGGITARLRVQRKES